MNRTTLGISVSALALAMACAGTQAGAAETTVSVDAGVGYSDNIARTNTNEIDQTLASVGFRSSVEEKEGRLTGSFNADLDYIWYSDSAYKDDLYGRVDLSSAYAFVPDVFTWVLDDSWGQNREVSFLPPSPANVENVNYLSTGPDLKFRFGSRTYLSVNGRYAMTTYQKTPRDYTSLGGGVGLFREMSQLSTLGLNARAFRVEYDNTSFGSTYDSQEATLSYATQGSRTTLNAEAGYSAIDSHGQTSNNPVFRFSMTREVGTATSLTLRLGEEYGQAGEVFRGGDWAPGGPSYGNPNDSQNVGDPFVERSAQLSLSTNKPRTSFSFGLRYRQEKYENLTEFDREVTSFYARVNRKLAETLSLRAGAEFEKEKYDNGTLDDDRLRLNLGMNWDVGRKTYVSVDWNYYNGDSNSALRKYTENQYWIRAGYKIR